MDNLDALIQEILVTLRAELPEKHRKSIKEFQSLVNQDLMRASYGVLDKICRKSDWHPSVKLLGLLDRYKIVF